MNMKHAVKFAELSSYRSTGHVIVTVQREGRKARRYRVTLGRFRRLRTHLLRWVTPAISGRPWWVSGYWGRWGLRVAFWRIP